MQRISSTSPHKIQPHQKDSLNHTQKLLAKRAAAKVVRRKINESQQMSKGNITQNTTNNQSEMNSKTTSTQAPQTNSNNNPTSTQSKQGQQNTNGIQSSQLTSNQLSKLSSQQISPSQSINATGLFASAAQSMNNQIQNQANQGQQQMNHQQQQQIQSHINIRKLNPYTIQQQKKFNQALKDDEEEEKTIAPMQSSNQPQKPFYSYETGPLDHAQHGKSVPHFQRKQGSDIKPTFETMHKPSPSQPSIKPGQQKQNQAENQRPSEDGEKILNKRHQMRIHGSNEASKRGSPHHNITRSLIEEGSEDFTNIEEHIQEETKASCRNAVASSLHNVSVLIKQKAQNNLRNRRGTTQSNMSGMGREGPSGQASKEETFETSSFFDEGTTTNRVVQSVNGAISPHKCNQVEGYNLPTIFNTLMFGIDQSKVSDRVRESFSKLKQRPQSRVSGGNMQPPSKQQTPRNQRDSHYQVPQRYSNYSKNEEYKGSSLPPKNDVNNSSKGKLSQLVTKVDKAPNILVFDNHQQQQNRNKKDQKQIGNSSPKGGGRQSQLQLVAQQNLLIEQHVEAPESLQTEIIDTNRLKNQEQNEIYDDVEHLQDEGQQEDDETDAIASNTASQIEDFQSSELHRNHLIQTLQSLQYIKTLPPVNKQEIQSRTVRLPPFRQHSSNIHYHHNSVFIVKKTIIFDLDETLVHCIDDIENNPCDQIINVTFPNGETVQAGINIRPYAIECLQKANENYQVVVFTASHKAYADVVLDYLDPERTLIQYRLYRDHCIRTEEGIYIKDLRIIQNRNLRDLIIVDNAVYSFGYQLDNGIPIIPFYDDKNDEELMHLIFYFNCLAQCDDVRDQNRKAFQLKDLQEIDIAEYLRSMMNNQNGSSQTRATNDQDEEDDN